MTRQQLRRTTAGPVGGQPSDTGCPILHVDMDAFYASVELLRHPELVGTPVIVAGGGSRGVVLSATYEARALGVHSAMPASRARRLAPQATFLTPHHDDYARISAGVMAVFASVTPLVEPLSLDEAFLDVSGALRRLGSPAQIGELIRTRVHDEQGITCSVGVASTKFVAKLASGRCKPDGLLVVPADRVIDFLHPLADRRAVGGRGQDRGGAAPPRAADGGRPGPHPGEHPRTCARTGGGSSPVGARLGPGRTQRGGRTPPTRASATRRPSTPTSTTPR